MATATFDVKLAQEEHRLERAASRLRCIIQHVGRPYGPLERIPESAWRELAVYRSPRAAGRELARHDHGTAWGDHYRVFAVWHRRRYPVDVNPQSGAWTLASSRALAAAMGLGREAERWACFNGPSWW